MDSILNNAVKVTHDPRNNLHLPETLYSYLESKVKESPTDIIHENNNQLVNDLTLRTLHNLDDDFQTVWYFGFGSNLHQNIFEGRRKLRPLQAYPGRLKGYELVFDLPALPYFEPTMGNLRVNESSIVHGCCFRLTQSQLKHLHNTEGGEDNYQLVPVDIELYQTGNNPTSEYIIRGFTLIAPSTLTLSREILPHNLPSRRYVDLIRNGARQRGLHSEWIQYLDQLPHTKPPTVLSKIFFLMFALGSFLFLGPIHFMYELYLRLILKLGSRQKRISKHLRLLKGYVWGLWSFVPLHWKH